MAEPTGRKRGFPPGVGWLPYTIAVIAALIAGTLAVLPQFATKTIGTTVVGGSGGGAGTGDSGGNVGGQAGGGGTTTTTAGGGPAGGGGGTGGGTGGQTSGGVHGTINCSRGQNGGATAPGVSASQIEVASTYVSPSSTSVGAGFLGEAGDGIRAAIAQFNSAGGDCGRRITDLSGDAGKGISLLNDDWNGPQGNSDINGWVHSSSPPFALVAEPDSEGLNAASTGGTIDSAGIPVVGTDGMLSSQYHDPHIFPVAVSTVSNMHIIAQYAVNTLHANSFGIVFDSQYHFGVEGANALAQELSRLGKSLNTSGGCGSGFCGIDPTSSSYSVPITQFDSACAPCDVVVMLLEPGPMESWMQQESGATNWYRTLEGGEPLFDDNLGSNCGGCGSAPLHVWTGYCAYGVSDPQACTGSAVSTFCQALHAISGSDDCQNEFTEGAYLGTLLFIQALQRVDHANLPLTRANLEAALNSGSYDLGLSQPLSFRSGGHIANAAMASYKDNYSGSFNGWTYDSTDFRSDAHRGSDL